MANNIIHTSFHEGLEIVTRSNSYRDRPIKGRVYDDIPSDDYPEFPKCRDLDCGSPQCRYQRDQHTSYWCEVDHKVWNRFHRALLREHKAILIPALTQHFGRAPRKLNWSRNAGCSCGCSPGWILDGAGWNTMTWVRPAKRIGPADILASNLAAIAREVSSLTRV